MLPILDISHYISDPESDEARRFVEQLRDTCHGPGFFYLVGHGVDSDLCGDTMDIANQFFDLPLEQRQAIAIENSAHFRGYTLLTHERTNGQVDWRDQLDVGPEEPTPNPDPSEPAWQRLRGPNQWPATLPQMPNTVMNWMEQMHPIGMALMQAIAVGIGQSADFFDDRMSPNPYTRVKIIRYPAQPEEGGSGQGLGLHNDSGIITFIMQDQIPGLQVLSEGKLVDVTPVPGAFIVNLGEMMQTATNGYLKATKHQVVSPPVGKQRISIAFFLNPRLDARFEPVDLPEDLARKATGTQDTNPENKVFSMFGVNTLKTRLRSHPDVTSAFYSDVDMSELQ
ncbi:MAG: isopenicillin N synthase-like dioxygenase [bacterium]|jgi:isopenicillin N synthase-like dioxygenase